MRDLLSFLLVNIFYTDVLFLYEYVLLFLIQLPLELSVDYSKRVFLGIFLLVLDVSVLWIYVFPDMASDLTGSFAE